MVRRFVGCLVGLGVLTTALGIASAAGMVEGAGFRLRLPAGFEAFEDEGGGDSPAPSYDLLPGRAAREDPSIRVFTAGSVGHKPGAVLLVVRIGLRAGMGPRTSRDLHAYLLDHVRVDETRFGRLMADGRIQLRNADVGACRGVEMAHAGVDGPLGPIEPPTRALAVVGEDFLMVMVLHVHDPEVFPPDETWAQLRGSLEIDPPAAFARTALLYGGAAVALLIVLVLLVRLRARARQRAMPVYRPALAGAAASREGWTAPKAPSEDAAPALTAAVVATEAPDGLPPDASEAPARPLPPSLANEGLGTLPRRQVTKTPARQGLKLPVRPGGRYSD